MLANQLCSGTILNFGYDINFKYKGMLAHSFDRFYIVTKFILPSIGDLKFSNLNYDNMCTTLKQQKCSKHRNKEIYVGFENLFQEN